MTKQPKQTQTLQNEHIVVHVSQGPGCQVSMEIEVSPKETELAYQKAVKSVSKEVSIPGFRKGKAPAALVNDAFQKAISKEWEELVATLGVREALKLAQLYPYKTNEFSSFKLDKFSREEGAKMRVSFDSFPIIPDVDPKDLRMEDVAEEPVSEKEIADFVEQTRLYFAKWNENKDRPAKDRDYVLVDIEKLSDPKEMLCSNQRAHLVKGEVADWIYNSLINMTPGESIETLSEKLKNSCGDEACHDPAHHHDDGFEPALCKITLRTILEPELPAIDEAFATKVGCKDITEFHQRAVEATHNRAKNLRQNKRRNRLYDLLLSKYSFEVPNGLVNYNVQHQIAQTLEQEQDPQRRAHLQQTLLKEVDQIRHSLVSKIQTEFLIGKLANQFNIKVEPEDVSQEIMQELVMSGAMKDQGEMQKAQEMITKRIVANKLTEKTLDYLLVQSFFEQ